jgi:hypothetical protein
MLHLEGRDHSSILKIEHQDLLDEYVHHQSRSDWDEDVPKIHWMGDVDGGYSEPRKRNRRLGPQHEGKKVKLSL